MTAETAIFVQDPSTIDLVGTWRLIENIRVEDGIVVDPEHSGPNPHGFIHYLPDRRISVIIARSDRAEMSTTRHDVLSDEAAAAWASFNAYAGTYTRTDDTVVHHIEINSYQNDVGTDYVRRIEVENGDLVLCTPEEIVDGRRQVFKLRWRRVA